MITNLIMHGRYITIIINNYSYTMKPLKSGHSEMRTLFIVPKATIVYVTICNVPLKYGHV